MRLLTDFPPCPQRFSSQRIPKNTTQRPSTPLSTTTTISTTSPSPPPSPTAAMVKKLSKQTQDASSSSFSSSVLPPSFTDGLPLPKLIVFDLDYTLWPFWVDTHVTPPLKPSPASPQSAAVDRFGDTYAFYQDVPAILAALPKAGVRVAVASRTHAPEIARDLLRILHVSPAAADDSQQQQQADAPASSGTGGSGSSSRKKDKESRPRRAVEFFDAGIEAYPSSKIRHFETIQRRTGVSFTEMLFFDDESRNKDTETLGVTMQLVRDGTSWGMVEKGVQLWRRRRGIGQGQ